MFFCSALPSKRLKLKADGGAQPVGRILSKKQRKRLEKIVDIKKKKENRAQLLKVRYLFLQRTGSC